MRIESGVTTRYIYFVGVDATDLKTRETGLASFTVYRSRNGAAAAAMTTPTINETDSTNMPGVYELLLDEDMTIGAGNDSEEMVFHITHAGMAPVTRTIELYRPKITAGNTLDVTATGAAGIDWGNVENLTTSNNLSGTTIGTLTAMAGTITTLDALDTAQDSQHSTTQGQVSGLNNISTTQVNTEVANAIVTYRLDHLMHTAVVGTDITDNTVIAKMVSKSATADWDSFNNTTDSLEAVRDRGDASWVTGTSDATAANQSTIITHLTDIKGATWSSSTDTLEAIRDNSITAAQVNTEVVDALATDTYAEPGQGAPASTTTLAAKINYLYKFLRNKSEQTATTFSVYDDAGTTVDQKATVSDDGTTATKGEIVSGP